MVNLRSGQTTTISGELARAVAERLEHHFHDYLAQFPDVPADVRLNDPWPSAAISRRYSSFESATPKAGFSLEINRALYLTPREDGLSDVIPGSIEAVNQRFVAFVRDIMPLFTKNIDSESRTDGSSSQPSQLNNHTTINTVPGRRSSPRARPHLAVSQNHLAEIAHAACTHANKASNVSPVGSLIQASSRWLGRTRSP